MNLSDKTRREDLKIRLALYLLKRIDYRIYEFKIALKFLEDCEKVLDVGCGRGTFIQNDPSRIYGLEYNSNNVEACLEKGYHIIQGDATDMCEISDNTYDGVYCSHLIQIFDYHGALTLLNELRRVVKPNGIIVLVTFPDNKRLFDTPETCRAYPPHAIRSMIRQPQDIIDPSTAPTYAETPQLSQEAIWMRRPALIDFNWQKTEILEGVGIMLNLLQHAVYLRKYWNYDGYVMKLRNGPKNLQA